RERMPRPLQESRTLRMFLRAAHAFAYSKPPTRNVAGRFGGGQALPRAPRYRIDRQQRAILDEGYSAASRLEAAITDRRRRSQPKSDLYESASRTCLSSTQCTAPGR